VKHRDISVSEPRQDVFGRPDVGRQWILFATNVEGFFCFEGGCGGGVGVEGDLFEAEGGVATVVEGGGRVGGKLFGGEGEVEEGTALRGLDGC